MSAAQTLRPGRYRHFKGKEYELLFVATHSETLEPMVVYRALYGERGVWVRPAAMWSEMIEHGGRPSAASRILENDISNEMGSRWKGCGPLPWFWD